MDKKRRIFLIVLSGFFMFVAMFFVINFVIEDAAAVGIIGGADGPTAIYISEKPDWKNLLIYTLIVIVFDIIIFKIIEGIGKKRQKSLVGVSEIIIIFFNLFAIEFLFPIPHIAKIGIVINAVIVILFVVRKVRSRKDK